MEPIKQISVYLENKPGRLANALSALAHAKVNLMALSVMDSHEHNVLRLVPDNLAATKRVLQGLSIPFAESDVLQIELRNQPGALAHVFESLAAAHVCIDYAYCSAGGRSGKTLGIMKVTPLDKAVRILSQSSNHTPRRRMGRRPVHLRGGRAPAE